ncbi:hypothetical protein H4R34_001993 [Dimargaris verticillata]|uniref:PPP4R2-domain-containing protein n=1 Tax=Dimargaris verticillata TaxID=2761393 RepID=A0A9W8B8X2_9FUNG|nr:hypothetical protein H4R34_001993 [Dimargaris verticillata]
MAQNATSPPDRPSASLPRTPESGPSPASLASPSKSPQSPNTTPSSPEPDETYLKLKAVAETNTVTKHRDSVLTAKLAKTTRQKSADTSMLETEAKEFQERLSTTLREFYRPPFTIQRICELVTVHNHQYGAPMKFLRAFEKAVLVTSTVDDFPAIPNGDSHPAEPSTLMASIAAPSSEVGDPEIPLSAKAESQSTGDSVRDNADPDKTDHQEGSGLVPAMTVEATESADTRDLSDGLHSAASPPMAEGDRHPAHEAPKELTMDSMGADLTNHAILPDQPPPTTVALVEAEPAVGADDLLEGSSSPTRMDVSSDEPLSDLAMEDDEVNLGLNSPTHTKVTPSPQPASSTAPPSAPEVAMDVSDDNEDLMETDTM